LAALSTVGKAHFATALAQGLANATYEITIIGNAQRRGPFPCDRVVVNDKDPANQGRGEYVVSFRFVIPPGDHWSGPATTAEVWSGGSILFKTSLVDFRCALTHSSMLFINFPLGG
jgi:hypothetical protein